MWGFQFHFQNSVKHAIRRLLDLLNKDIEVEIFLVGVLADEKPGSHPICLEPEDCGFTTNDFESVLEDASIFMPWIRIPN